MKEFSPAALRRMANSGGVMSLITRSRYGPTVLGVVCALALLLTAIYLYAGQPFANTL
jgi:hypothetical protein